jgi:hypothetical protein
MVGKYYDISIGFVNMLCNRRQKAPKVSKNLRILEKNRHFPSVTIDPRNQSGDVIEAEGSPTRGI